MARLNDTSGIPNTCPKIDFVLDFLNNLEITDEDEGFTFKDIKDLCDTLEEIRTANDGLRTHGSILQNEVDEVKTNEEFLESRIKDLESDIEQYKTEISNLEDELSEKTELIESLEDELAK